MGQHDRATDVVAWITTHGFASALIVGSAMAAVVDRVSLVMCLCHAVGPFARCARVNLVRSYPTPGLGKKTHATNGLSALMTRHLVQKLECMPDL